MTGISSHLAVGAIVRRGSDILLVSERTDDEPEPVWALPGGMVAPGESLLRKVAEETGLVSVQAEMLLWVARYSVGGQAFEALGFAVAGDGDGAGDSEWVPLDEAVSRLERMWFAPIREPAVAYLSGRAVVATLWSWQRLDGPPETVPELR